MTNHWVDIRTPDLVFVMGGNPAETHPCGLQVGHRAKKTRKAKLVVVDPRFNRTAAVAGLLRTDPSGNRHRLFSGIINYLLSNDKIQHEYVKHYTNAAFPDRRRLQVPRRSVLRYDEAKRSYARTPEVPDRQRR